jgi:hypothetical protein
MSRDWKLRQQIFHKIFSSEEIGDDLKNEIIVEKWNHDEIVAHSIDYLFSDSEVLYYPAKSYAVAVTYAMLLQKEFGEDVIACLCDKELLYNNDPYFKTYDEQKDLYEEILQKFPREAISHPERYSANFQKTHEYFYLEFLLHERTKVYAQY